jgi:hypothetical protein
MGPQLYEFSLLDHKDTTSQEELEDRGRGELIYVG